MNFWSLSIAFVFSVFNNKTEGNTLIARTHHFNSASCHSFFLLLSSLVWSYNMPLHEFSNGTSISTYILFKQIFLLKMCLFWCIACSSFYFQFAKNNGVCVCGGGGGGGREGSYFLYMVLYGCVCRIAPFFNTVRYIISPTFFQQKVYD